MAAPAPQTQPTDAPASNDQPSAQNASLYCGDLPNDITEAALFDVFKTVGPVLSIRVCRDSVTRRSLGYAYVNFQNPSDAERALETLNYNSVGGKPIRIMWCHRDPSLRKSSNGNVFIKNLHPEIDNQTLYDTFSQFGNILSCKVAMDGSGKSLGHGFVHFETEAGAEAAIQKVNGMQLMNQKVFVGPFLRRGQRLQESENAYTNVYIRNFKTDVTADKVNEVFGKFGKIKSSSLQADKKSRPFAFVDFENHDSAVQAVADLNDKPSELCEEGTNLFVGRAQKKSERAEQLKRKFAAERSKRQAEVTGSNLYVKNLDDAITDEDLKAAFSKFGELTSVRVMTDDSGTSKGFGFVAFKELEAATAALNQMNGQLLGAKPLYVNVAQKKETRRATLEIQYAARAGGRGMGPGMPGPGGMGGYQYGYPPGAFFGAPQQFGYGGGRGGRGMMPQGFNPQMPFGMVPNGGRGMGGRGGRGGPVPGRMPVGYPGFPQGGAKRPPNVPGMPPVGNPGFTYTKQARNQAVPGGPQMGAMPPAATAPQAAIPGGMEPLTPAALAQMPPEQQKNMLGERLFARINESHSEYAAKITGMLLEMDISEQLNLLETPAVLKAKIDEALDVLKLHEAGRN